MCGFESIGAETPLGVCNDVGKENPTGLNLIQNAVLEGYGEYLESAEERHKDTRLAEPDGQDEPPFRNLGPFSQVSFGPPRIPQHRPACLFSSRAGYLRKGCIRVFLLSRAQLPSGFHVLVENPLRSGHLKT